MTCVLHKKCMYTLIYANYGIFFYISTFFVNKLAIKAMKTVKIDVILPRF